MNKLKIEFMDSMQTKTFWRKKTNNEESGDKMTVTKNGFCIDRYILDEIEAIQVAVPICCFRQHGQGEMGAWSGGARRCGLQ